jgi:transposase InsO family protein
LWVADFTYCSTWSDIVYVAFIIDVYSRVPSAGKRRAP